MTSIERPAPGYIILKPYKLNRKVGNWQISAEGEDAPDLGEVLQVGPEIAKMPYDAKYLPKKGSIVAYKKYNVFKLALGSEESLAVHFDNFLFEVKA